MINKPVPPPMINWRSDAIEEAPKRAKLPFEIRIIRDLTQYEARKYIAKYSRMPRSKIKEALEQDVSGIESVVAALFMRCIEKADYNCFVALMDRALGKPELVLETEEDKADREEIEKLTHEELINYIISKVPSLTLKQGE